MLLDFAEFPAAARQWWNREDLAQIWAGAEVGDEDAGWANHVEQASKTIEDIRQGNERLGTQPDDLFDTLAAALRCAMPPLGPGGRSSASSITLKSSKPFPTARPIPQMDTSGV
jgi:hypothetical protein